VPKLNLSMSMSVSAADHEAAKKEVSEAVDSLRSDTESGRALIASFKAAVLQLIDEAHAPPRWHRGARR